MRNIDIGAYDTCLHDCVYCYANDPNRSSRSSRSYDRGSEMLGDTIREGDRIVEIGRSKNHRLSDFAGR